MARPAPIPGAPAAVGSSSSLPTSIGEGEGGLNLIAWQGYTEPNVVKPFEKQTGCQVKVKYGQTSDEMVQLMRSGQYDGVSASGDATNRLIAGGDVVPINTDLIPDFKDISAPLQSPPHNTVDGVHYGVSYEWGANVLMYNTDVVKPAPDSWGVVFDGTSYSGKVTAYDSPIYIADAAAVPEGDAARPGDHGSLRADTGPVQRGCRPAEDAAQADRQLLVRLQLADPGLQERQHRDRLRPGRTR